jgi:hypothetical protein
MALLPRELSKYRLNIQRVLRKNGIPLDLHNFGGILAKNDPRCILKGTNQSNYSLFHVLMSALKT